MKKQNIIIFVVFLMLIVGFYLVSCKNDDANIDVNIGEATIEQQKYVSVSLTGQFERTGNFTVPVEWTLKTLFEYAGIKPDGDISGYDLNSHVIEGEVYYIPKLNGQTKEGYSEKININTADIKELSTLLGIGETLALRIIEYRQAAPFTSKEDIKKVKGVGDGIYEKIKDFITV